MSSRILEDDSVIRCLTNERLGVDVAFVGGDGVTRIVAYGEPGDGALVPWFAIWRGDKIVKRIAAAHVSVHYFTRPPTGESE